MDGGDLIGARGRVVDPLWDVRVDLLPVEQELLTTWWVRRLAHVAHAGAAAWTTAQSYSRLEHSLGVLALTVHFAPDDVVGRVAALLHDIGHLPLSHTFERAGGFHHHEVGDDRLAELSPVLRRHGLEPAAVAERQHTGSRARRADGLLGSDHLDSFVRSGRSHGWSRDSASDLLRRLRLRDGVVETDAATAEQLATMAALEAAAQCDEPNVVAYAVTERAAAVLIDGADDAERDRIAAMTDAEFWTLALADARTAELVDLLRRSPGHWRARVLSPDEAVPDGAIGFVKHRLYAVLPLVDGRPHRTAALDGLPPTPVRFAVEPR